MTIRASVLTAARRSITTIVAIAIGVVLVLMLLSGVVNREIAWSAGRSAGRFSLPVPEKFADTTALFAAVDAYVAEEMRAVRAPGLSIVIVHAGNIVHRRSFGFANGDGRRVTTSTPFILGSLTKSFTALAILQQVDDGRIDLDAPVQRYLSWFTVRDRAAGAQITVRELLNHTSGIPKSAGLQLIRGAEAATRAQEARLVKGVRLHNPPGAEFEYSNANYWLLGLVLEAVTGESYEAYVRERIFVPLGMQHTYTDERQAQANGLAKGHRIWFGYPRAEELPYYWREMSVGYLISTADDMGLFLLAQLKGASDGGPQVISERGLSEMHTPPLGSPYAMGWLADSVAATPVLWHTGAVANYHGDMLLLPSHDWGVVLLSNVNNFILEDQLSGAVKGIASLVLGYQPQRQPLLRFRASYVLITVGAAIWLAWRIRQFVTLQTWRRRRRATRSKETHHWYPAGALIDPGVAIGLFFGVPILLGSPLSTLRWFVPDLTDWLIINTFLAIALAGMRLASSNAARREP